MIRFDQVTKTYRGTQRPALDDVTLEIVKGEFVFLVGQSGSGKSSFLRLVLKEERPSRGRIHVLGQSLGTLSTRKVPYFRRSLGVVFQDFRLLTNKNVFDNVAFTLQVIGKSRAFIQQAVPDVLKLVGLAGKQHRMPHELSGGEQQRVAIARAVVNKPAILLADEPTGNLDPATSVGIMALLSAINANGTTVVMATHDATIVDQMQRRVVELVAGRIVRDERGGGYQTQTVPIQRAQEQLVSTGRIPDAEAAAEEAQLAALQGRRPGAERSVATAFETGAIEYPTIGAATASMIRAGAAVPPDPVHRAEQAKDARAEPHPARSASEALADAVSRATSALPVQHPERDLPRLNEPADTVERRS